MKNINGKHILFMKNWASRTIWFDIQRFWIFLVDIIKEKHHIIHVQFKWPELSLKLPLDIESFIWHSLWTPLRILSTVRLLMKEGYEVIGVYLWPVNTKWVIIGECLGHLWQALYRNWHGIYQHMIVDWGQQIPPPHFLTWSPNICITDTRVGVLVLWACVVWHFLCP